MQALLALQMPSETPLKLGLPCDRLQKRGFSAFTSTKKGFS
ncbi:hypothetical protein DB42_AU00080 [Neochlamydia sp. EPS4]|nr:hypothetical protein DB42_AU00080 [Neochlamydia sp. EPS4]